MWDHRKLYINVDNRYNYNDGINKHKELSDEQHKILFYDSAMHQIKLVMELYFLHVISPTNCQILSFESDVK